LRIPEIEFEIGRSEKRELDAIYNHLARAMYNLTQHCRTEGMGEVTKAHILATVEQISSFLDIPKPWQLVLYDPSGKSVLKPCGEDVTVTYEDELPVAAEQA